LVPIRRRDSTALLTVVIRHGTYSAVSEVPPSTEGELRSILLFFLEETHERLQHLAAQPWNPEIRAKLAALSDQVRALKQALEAHSRLNR
jgi:hypothetical protein